MTRITPRPIPPTISHGSGLSREWVNGSLYTTSGDVKGRYWLALLIGLCVLVAAFSKANDRLRGEHTPAQAEHVQRLMRLIGALGEKLPPVPFTPDLERMEAA